MNKKSCQIIRLGWMTCMIFCRSCKFLQEHDLHLRQLHAHPPTETLAVHQPARRHSFSAIQVRLILHQLIALLTEITGYSTQLETSRSDNKHPKRRRHEWLDWQKQWFFNFFHSIIPHPKASQSGNLFGQLNQDTSLQDSAAVASRGTLRDRTSDSLGLWRSTHQA